MKIKIWLKIVAFFAIFILLFNMATALLKTADRMNYHNIGGFYEESKESLDAVYIGSSNCFTFWNSLLAWGEYGMSIYPYAGNSFFFFASEYYIREARKTQPDALYIVNINSLSDGEMKVQAMRNMIDSMPFSLNKLRLIHHLAEIGDFSMTERMEFYLPMIRFHTRWKELSESDVSLPLDGRKGAAFFDAYLKTSTDITAKYVLSEKERPLSDALYQSTKSLLDYCERENVKILFVTVPQAKQEEFRVERINALNAYIQSRGFPILDLLAEPEKLGIDPTVDFYNTAHTNIHGSIKFTYYLADYLKENYGFSNKRQNENYEQWNQAYESYCKEISPYTLDIELDAHNRDYGISAPSATLAIQGGSNKISWQSVQGAEGYIVYKKSGKSPSWVAVGDTKECTFSDSAVEAGEHYSYTILPYRDAKSGRMYGDFSYSGSSVQR